MNNGNMEIVELFFCLCCFYFPELAMATWCYEFIFLLDKHNFVHEEDTRFWSLYCYDDRNTHNLL